LVLISRDQSLQQWDTSGTFLGDFGQVGATGTALDGAGSVYTVAPSFGNNRIEKYNSAQTVLGTFTSAANGEWIEDMAWGGGNSIWVSTCCSGSVMNIDATTGVVNSSFNALGGAIMGVAFDGTDLWTTDGFGSGSSIYQYSTSGVLLNTINTGFAGGGGIGYSALTNSLWVGYNGIVRQFDTSGNFLSSFNSNGGFHDGLEIGEISMNSVPEPATLALMALGLAGLGFRRKLQA